MYLCIKILELVVYYNFGVFDAFFANKDYDIDFRKDRYMFGTWTGLKYDSRILLLGIFFWIPSFCVIEFWNFIFLLIIFFVKDGYVYLLKTVEIHFFILLKTVMFDTWTGLRVSCVHVWDNLNVIFFCLNSAKIYIIHSIRS